MSLTQKLFTGSLNTRQCKHCGKGVYISWKYSIWLIIFLLAILFTSRLMKLDSTQIMIIGLLALVVFSAIQVYLIPLAKDRIDEKLE